MGDANGGVGSVDGLTARAGGAEGIDAKIFGFDLDVDVFGFGKNGDGDRGGVDASLLLGGGNALDAMNSAFIFKARVDAIAFDEGDDFFQASNAGFGGG